MSSATSRSRLTVAEGEELVRLVEAGPTLFALTHHLHRLSRGPPGTGDGA